MAAKAITIPTDWYVLFKFFLFAGILRAVLKFFLCCCVAVIVVVVVVDW
jgi:hypothetical protein